MTILYRPVLIESAEQVEALPEDAIVIGSETGERYTKTYDGEWWGATEMVGPLSRDVKYEKIVALVPIEAEERHSEDYGSYHLMEAVDGPKPFTAYLVDQEEA